MELTVKDFKKALSNVDENKIVYVEGGFGHSDIHVVYDIRELSNGNIMVNIDGCCGEDDRKNTQFDYEYFAESKSLIKEV